MKENLPALGHMEQNVSHLLSLTLFNVVIAISSKEHLADNLLQRCRQLIDLTVKLPYEQAERDQYLVSLNERVVTRHMQHHYVYYSMVILAQSEKSRCTLLCLILKGFASALSKKPLLPQS